MKSGNLETVMKEASLLLCLVQQWQLWRLAYGFISNTPRLTNCVQLTDYLNSRSIAAQPFNYTHGLVENLVQFGLEKIEILMVLNHLPKNETELDVLVEELETRLSEEQIQTILTAIQQLDEV